MNRGTARVAALLFFSGACALAYQTTWLRQFRLIFGASTYATAAVLAIFMGGLGAGSAILGKRADARSNPLAFYGTLELLIATAAALSQPLLFVVSKVYFALGGSTTLGLFVATFVRLLLALIVLGAPTFLMGGTLPAAARAVASDGARRSVGVLYGVNTLGAVLGTLVTTFYVLERLGNRSTLLVAVGVNVCVGIVAIVTGRVDASSARPRESAAAAAWADEGVRPSDKRFVLIASAVVGFTFLLMELVWYRMLGPLLGGTTFMFGLILAVALLGIGLGGAAYALRGDSSRATIGGFALTCTLEALAIVVPFALGDRIAVVTNLIRPIGVIGFAGNIVAWCAVTFLVVFPAAFISGIQFPLLIALLGSGREDVGRHVGLAYAFNTLGAIAGSLAAGFVLFPLLGATACWLFASYLLIALGAVATYLAVRNQQIDVAAVATLVAVFAIGGTFALGPTAVWRHSGIGAGRAVEPKTRREIREWINSARRTLVWDADGRESSIALSSANDDAFIVNGKADGSAHGDAGTQVMSGMLASILHGGRPRTACVIGLGTGSSAGWLGAVPSMERVDVVELEPVVLRIASDMSAVNHDVLHNPKVHIHIADAREVLLASRDRYDIIFSEPSNPYRAGIASLFTREYYAAIATRLAPRGVFVQWVQTYDIDAATVGTIYKTITSVFPNVETWRGEPGDLFLVATAQPLTYDTNSIRALLTQSPFREAMNDAWHKEGVEGFFSHYLAGNDVARRIAANAGGINTDDRTLIEFGFARSLGAGTIFTLDQVSGLVTRPPPVRGAIDWNLVLLEQAADTGVPAPRSVPAEFVQRRNVALAWDAANFALVRNLWRQSRFAPIGTSDLRAIAVSLADDGDELAASAAERLRPWHDGEAEAILGELRAKQNRLDEAAPHILRAFAEYRSDPWLDTTTMGRLFDAAGMIARRNPQLALATYEAFDKPWAAGQWGDARRYYLVSLGSLIRPCGPAMLRALADLEPYPHWREDILKARVECYSRAHLTELSADARRDWEEWQSTNPAPLVRSRPGFSSNRR